VQSLTLIKQSLQLFPLMVCWWMNLIQYQCISRLCLRFKFEFQGSFSNFFHSVLTWWGQVSFESTHSNATVIKIYLICRHLKWMDMLKDSTYESKKPYQYFLGTAAVALGCIISWAKESKLSSLYMHKTFLRDE
jgi:hypothetical protein